MKHQTGENHGVVLQAEPDGWGGRIRTFEWRLQRPLPYHLATPHRSVKNERGDYTTLQTFAHRGVFSLAPLRSIPYTRAVMFAIVKIAGFQERVEEGMKLKVPTLDQEAGSTVTFKDVLLTAKSEDAIAVGTPVLSGASVAAKVLAHGQADKVRVYKMRRRKRYRRLHGHRQGFTEIEITKITA